MTRTAGRTWYNLTVAAIVIDGYVLRALRNSKVYACKPDVLVCGMRR